MGDGTPNSPYTSEDVKNLIKNRGNADGLDLSGKIFEKCIDLKRLDLHGIILNNSIFLVDDEKYEGAHLEGAILWDAHLESTYFMHAHFEGADLSTARLDGAILSNAHLENVKYWAAHLEGADLIKANLDNANLSSAHLEGINLRNAEFTRDTQLETAYWGNYILGEEIEVEKNKNKQIRTAFLSIAADTYRRLKNWYTEHGIYDVAGKFFYREMEVKRKVQNWKEKPLLKLWYWIMRMLCGYGERPKRVVISAAAILLVLALVYFLIGAVWQWEAFWRSLYFSTVSFTALGYGSWVNVTNDLVRGLGAAESFLGVFMMALFLVTFTRKMTR